ncbi:MAG: succinate dehydrogenase cytochrome b subunit [Muribaculaceae bacterium]|nr:succinate dehydrogenase cytochrome b subunit [Muribaculaceae bacterium]
MWLTCSSVGRKFVMAISGAVLVLFVTFHCCMNSIAICWPAAYNSLCEFLGANWYALIASAGLAFFILLHIVYACVLTLQNRKARGPVGYEISKKPKAVEWSSKNMLVLGIVILAFLVVHLIQFWAKMQLQEIRGVDDVLPPAAGTLFLQEAFQLNWTWIVYIIGMIALWFHLNHGIWSMFQSVGWDNTKWIERFKKLALCWSSIICLVFIAQVIVFTAKAHEGYFKNDPVLREQYKEMIMPEFEKDFGPDAAQMGVPNISVLSFDDFSTLVDYLEQSYESLPESLDDPRIQMNLASLQTDEQKENFLKAVSSRIEAKKRLKLTKGLLNYLNGNEGDEAPAFDAIPNPVVTEGFTEELIEEEVPADFSPAASEDSDNINN